MMTYPLSEAATIYATGYGGEADVLGRGTLVECAEIVERLQHHQRFAATIKMDAIGLTYPPIQVDELLRFLKERQVRL